MIMFIHKYNSAMLYIKCVKMVWQMTCDIKRVIKTFKTSILAYKKIKSFFFLVYLLLFLSKLFDAFKFVLISSFCFSA